MEQQGLVPSGCNSAFPIRWLGEWEVPFVSVSACFFLCSANSTCLMVCHVELGVSMVSCGCFPLAGTSRPWCTVPAPGIRQRSWMTCTAKSWGMLCRTARPASQKMWGKNKGKPYGTEKMLFCVSCIFIINSYILSFTVQKFFTGLKFFYFGSSTVIYMRSNHTFCSLKLL